MPFDLSKPFKMGRVKHLGLVPPGDPMFSGGPMIAGKRMDEWLANSPKKSTDEDKVAALKGKAKGKAFTGRATPPARGGKNAKKKD